MSETDETECRICREESPPLLRPCRCASVVHVKCLQQWVESRTSSLFPLTYSPTPPSCEVCLVPYSAAKSQKQWNTADGLTEDSGQLGWMYQRCGVCMPDPLALLPRSAFCDHLVSLESCLLLCLTVLAFSGHTIFLVHMRANVSAYEYPRERVLLAGLNAVLSACILILVQKIVSRWLRDGSNLTFSQRSAVEPNDIESASLMATARSSSASESTLEQVMTEPEGVHTTTTASSTGVTLSRDDIVDVSNLDEARQQPRFSRRSSHANAANSIGHFVLGAFLSLAASAEVYLLLSAL